MYINNKNRQEIQCVTNWDDTNDYPVPIPFPVSPSLTQFLIPVESMVVVTLTRHKMVEG